MIYYQYLIELGSQDHPECNDILTTEHEFIIDHFDKWFKIFFINLMSKIEMWDYKVDKIIVHPTLLYLIRQFNTDAAYIGSNKMPAYHIYGVEVLFDTEIPSDTILALADIYGKVITLPKHVAIGKIDLPLIERLNNLKVFW